MKHRTTTAFVSTVAMCLVVAGSGYSVGEDIAPTIYGEQAQRDPWSPTMPTEPGWYSMRLLSSELHYVVRVGIGVEGVTSMQYAGKWYTKEFADASQNFEWLRNPVPTPPGLKEAP